MLFQLYSEHAVMQIIGWVLVFCGLILMNEILIIHELLPEAVYLLFKLGVLFLVI